MAYSTSVVKYDRHGYKPRERILIISKQNLHVLECKGTSIKQKHCLPLKSLSFVVSPENDKLLLVQIPEDFIKKDKVISNVKFKTICLRQSVSVCYSIFILRETLFWKYHV
ncbi:hypothetical protein NQ314_021314 [Rhamnusium bicolor]|uniref:TH1 domain-containing protein n=1 Tax=Rhamnusium bicolor TaxID=1586634 RepID=A0AAV8WIJ4_9CUCU|nr:hypothetical protein NQ314_021314 [Rhamnusium bicolor]